MFTNETNGILVSEAQLEGITIPYNTPDVGLEPEFYLDMTAKGEGVTPVRKLLDRDQFDSTFWQSKLINSAIMPWIPFFSNCEGFDTRMVLFDLLEYHAQCKLPSYNDIKVVNPIPSSGLDPVADRCNLAIKCIYDEPLSLTVASSTRWY